MAKACTRVGVIMAGGSGERFWPLSRRDRPKQLLNLTSPDKNMLQEAVERIAPLIPPERVFIVTGEHLVKPIRAGRVGVPDANVLAEPCRRNTGGCLTYAAAQMMAKYGDPATISMAVTTADHQIGAPNEFRKAVRVALEAAEKHGILVTHGIVPTRPETGYGYIQAADTQRPLASTRGVRVYRVGAFHEKPNQQKAEDFISTGHYYWNSGMFFWRVETFLSELELAQPRMAQAARDMAAAIAANKTKKAQEIFEGLDDISIDYALMERSKNVAVVRAEYPWDDVGAWTSLDRTRKADKHGNVAHGNPVIVDCEDCIVYNDAGADRIAVSVVGVEDLIVVVSRDGVLVVPKSRAQDVRHAVAELKRRGATQV